MTIKINSAIQLSINGKLDESIKLFNQVLDAEPFNWYAHYNISLVYIKKGMFIEAKGHLEESLKLKRDKDCLRELGNCYIKLNNLDKAEDLLIESSNILESSITYNSIGVCYFLRSDFNNALVYFQKSVKLKPANRDAWFNLSDTYSELGLHREARKARYKYEKLGNIKI